MSTMDTRIRVVQAGQRLATRGLAPGTSGNISVKVDGGYVMTATARSLGEIVVRQLAMVDGSGRHVSGERPTKEQPLHLALYDACPKARAVVHLHSTAAVAVSCLTGLDPDAALPPLTPYQVMRLGPIRVVPYAPPGSEELAERMRSRAGAGWAFLLQNHGPIACGETLDEAVTRAEELEEASRVYLAIAGRAYRRLDDDQVADLIARFSGPTPVSGSWRDAPPQDEDSTGS